MPRKRKNNPTKEEIRISLENTNVLFPLEIKYILNEYKLTVMNNNITESVKYKKLIIDAYNSLYTQLQKCLDGLPARRPVEPGQNK